MRKTGSKERIRQFLRTRVGQVVTGKQIQDAVGPNVTEWARRVRELRSDEGWKILSHIDDNSLKPGQYKLAAARLLPMNIASANPYQIVFAPKFFNGTVTPVRCAAQEQANRMKTTRDGKFDCMSVT